METKSRVLSINNEIEEVKIFSALCKYFLIANMKYCQYFRSSIRNQIAVLFMLIDLLVSTLMLFLRTLHRKAEYIAVRV